MMEAVLKKNMYWKITIIMFSTTETLIRFAPPDESFSCVQGSRR